MAYSYANGTPAATVNGFEGLVPVVISDQGMTATPSTEGTAANLPAGATPVAAGNLPTTNAVGAQYTSKSSMVAMITWATRSCSTSTSPTPALAPGRYRSSTNRRRRPEHRSPCGRRAGLGQPDLRHHHRQAHRRRRQRFAHRAWRQRLFARSVDADPTRRRLHRFDAQVNGNAPSTIDKVQIGKDGTVYAQYKDGSNAALQDSAGRRRARTNSPRCPATFMLRALNPARSVSASPMRARPVPSSQARSKIPTSISPRNSPMIAAQRSYTANSKVFQTGSDLMDVLVNLKR